MTQLAKPLDLPWENDIPIDSEHVLLDLLYHEWGEKSDRVLWMPFEHVNDKTPPYIEIGWYCGGYTKEEHSKSYYFKVFIDTARSLKAQGLVKGTPKWGYTSERELSITERGGRLLIAKWEALGDTIPRSEDWMKRRHWR